MSAELLEIQSFIAQYAPFDQLPEQVIIEVAKSVEISYYRTDSMIVNFTDNITELYMIRSGVVELYRRKGELYNRLDQGQLFGQMGLLTNNKVRFPAKAVKDTLLYCIPESVFTDLCEHYDDFADFVEVEDTTRLKQAVKGKTSDNALTTSKVKTLLTREALVLPCNTTIQAVAKIMADENISAVLINDPTIENQQDSSFVGIITEHDLCANVIAAGINVDNPISQVMTTQLFSLDHNAYIFEAMLLMLRNNIHHLPILKNKKPIGLIEVADIIRYESQNSLLFVSSIFQQKSSEDLVFLSAQLKNCFVRMVNEDANSHMVGRAMSEIGRNFKQRLLELAEEKFGPPPVPYCFLALGSMARDEQLMVTDQDNAIILDNSYQVALHGAYFEQLANFVCDGLAACGYSYCTGDIMASNPENRKTRAQWEECFGDWIDNPNPQALLNCSIFFDLTGVYGRIKWAEQLNAFILRKAKKNNRFLACLAHNALNRKPPLGFFKDFVMEKDGRHNNSINLKRRGTAPLADLIRVHALAIGSQSQNSFERLEDIIEAGILPTSKGEDLQHAMELISLVRLRHQSSDIESGIEPDNNIEPESMSDFERRNLKDAFLVLSNAQNFLKYRYTANKL
ncbi:cyclic nucleotide-binding/CBS domain-containing protein [Shewanella sp. SR43-4]|jgi:CBS domain-containing protein|uniref:Nucleotidyltransferase substrate binding domain-containing protein n=1 Tax=Shewanella vesiculosa TaxID=518738 RepID=A0ABV0FPR9_9GAMM|nr:MULTISPECIES: putative nucleotidyltransferase substrate binding domain-containing protein [Shewanella]NCQ43777.1 cyclic nucleotide-binding/CBS domain-containing protein [Shewanella frigidimarina]MBB1316988.1 cyclic nucleotide-binding/CBS domain-containing protein [Shewanella sp. SR43-4]MBB1321867.1 cyclic nucleotide-binding/CBS domain-containing protein [Shewanella sp. SR43-8]MBB1390505.1 cyclic nucleotide-binding/CBS domain-containing protein [Shewanella sp. SG44-6]NCO70151.1 cyclic nucleo|tara:strand:- start:950 stop:2824 length:1875 start_codon:yes stop_codon:yes gene_type:complete